MSFFDLFRRRKNKQSNLNTEKIDGNTIQYHIGNVVSSSIVASENITELKQQYIAFNLETTGLNTEFDRIIEIGAVKFSDGIPTSVFSTLVNPHMPIPKEASAVHHITDSMVQSAPAEKEAIKNFIAFLGDAIDGKTLLCAHNASFDVGMLKNTMIRLGFNATLRYIDTLQLCRKHIHETANHKLNTIAQYFNIPQRNAHRAVDDADVCGHILLRLLPLIENSNSYETIKKNETHYEFLLPTGKELEACAVVQNIIEKKGYDSSCICFYKNKSKYMDAAWLYRFLRFKYAQKGSYIIVPRATGQETGLHIEECSLSEDGANNVRVYFNHALELEKLSPYIVSSYLECRKSFDSYSKYQGKKAQQEIENMCLNALTLKTNEIKAIIDGIDTSMTVDPSPREKKKKEIVNHSRDEVTISPKHSRVPLSEIRNRNNWDKGFDQGSPYYFDGEKARLAGELEEAIRLFDLARYHGYNAPALYEAYVKTYHKLKDYENEIVICEEGIERTKSMNNTIASTLLTRRNKAINLLFSQQTQK